MKNVVKFLFVLGLAVAAGALSLVPSQGQVGTQGSFPGVFNKNPAESVFSIAVSMRQGGYIRSATAAEFIHFTLSPAKQSAFIYLYDVAVKTGEVRLLFPNRAVQKNFLPAGEYAFPEDFMPGFPIDTDGLHFIQAIATQRPLDLSLGLEQFRLLGKDPEIVRLGIETLIRDQGLTRSQWAADWTSYSVVTVKPTSGDAADLVVSVIDSAGKEIPGAQLYVKNLSTGMEFDWTYISISNPPKTLKLNTGIRYLLKARDDPVAPRFETQLGCTLQSSPNNPKQPCEFSLSGNDKVIFQLNKLPPPSAGFKLDDPACVGTAVRFDASASEPQTEITKYVWNFGDRTAPDPVEVIRTDPIIPPDPIKTHTYRNEGDYTVTLRVYFRDGKLRPEDGPVVRSFHVSPEIDPICNAPPTPVSAKNGDGNITTEGNVVALRAKNGGATMIPVPNSKAPAEGDLVQVKFEYEFTNLPPQTEMGTKVFAEAKAVLRVYDIQQPLRPQLQEVCKILEIGQRPDVDRRFTCKQPISLKNAMSQLQAPRNRLQVELGIELNVSSTQDATGGFVNVRFNFVDNPLTGGPSSNCASVNTEQAYSLGTRVTITFRNECDQTIKLPNTAPWLIKNGSHAVVYVPPQTPAEIPLARGDTQYFWDQTDNQKDRSNPRQVIPNPPSGEVFTIEFTTITSDGKSELYITKFTVK